MKTIPTLIWLGAIILLAAFGSQPESSMTESELEVQSCLGQWSL